jgi:hypothetical protein
MAVPEAIQKLVEKYTFHRDAYLRGQEKYNETQLRENFTDRFLPMKCRSMDDPHMDNMEFSDIQQGDWTKDRKKILENDPDKIIKSIMARRKKSRLHA